MLDNQKVGRRENALSRKCIKKEKVKPRQFINGAANCLI